MIKYQFYLGAWGQTFEHLSSIRRYSHQPLTTSISTIDLTEKSTLRRKAQSLDGLHQVGISAQPIITNRLNPPTTVNYTSDHQSTDDDEEEEIFHTRL